MKLNKIKFEQGRIHFISEFSVCFDPEILLPWERDVTTSFLYWELSLAVKKLDCKTVGFFLKISNEIGKAWRKSLRRAKRASLMRREKKNRLSVFHTMSSFRPGGSKMSSSCQKSVRNSALFVNLMDSSVIIDAVIQYLALLPCEM